MQAKKLYQNEVDFAFKREYVEAMTLLATKLPVHHMMLVGRDTGEGAVIWTRAIPTAATDSVWVYVNPDFFLSLQNASQRAFVLAHEVGHIMFKHMFRSKVFSDRGWFAKEGGKEIGWSRELYNVAGDYIINADLVAQGLEMPIDDKGEQIGLLDDQFTARDITEEVYLKLYDDKQDDEPEGQDPSGDSEDSEGQPSPDQSGAGESGESDPDQSGTEESSESGFEGDEPTADESGAGKPQGHGGQDIHLDPVYEGTPEEQKAQADADAEEIVREFDRAVDQADEQSRTLSGEYSKNSDRYKSDRDALVEDWREQLAEYLNRSSREGRANWGKIHKRAFMTTGTIRPTKKGGLSRLIIIDDISESVNQNSRQLFKRETAELIDQIQPASGTLLISTNHMVAGTFEAYSGQELLDYEGPLGGGTYLSSALDWIEEEGDSADVILAFTDGFTDQHDYDRLASENVIMVFDTYRHWIYARHYIEQSGIRTIIADDTMAA